VVKQLMAAEKSTVASKQSQVSASLIAASDLIAMHKFFKLKINIFIF